MPWIGYRFPGHRCDEMLGREGSLRPHWARFSSCVAELGETEFDRRWADARRLLTENGVTYNLYSDPSGASRPWSLDSIPLLIAADEAEQLQAGMRQRGRLLEAVLSDLYGPQRLLADGLLPPELVFGNPAFLRPCHGLLSPTQKFLHLLASDLGRGPDGRFIVLGDRTQAPSGAGYALENRLVMARMLPEVFRACNVQRLAMFFRTFREALRACAPHNRDNPRIVLLTPGRYNETYFEHAYLAQYLGFTLAEGPDLTVRDHRVYLRFLEGLQPVDVILRRVDDAFCDPLELRADSFLGVPGLVQAIRMGNVVLANGLGSALAESPALLPYLPRLCRALLGEELLLHAAPTHWCGEPASLSHVRDRFDRLVIKAAFPPRQHEPIFVDRLSAAQREEWLARISARPHAYVAQEHVELSTAPILSEHAAQPRHVVVRMFAAAGGDGFTAMPGGLTRFAPSKESLVVSMQHGGGSKDTWVTTTGPVHAFSLLKTEAGAIELSRGGSDLPSRAADNLFWLGRYAERAECLARTLRCVLVRLTERNAMGDCAELPALLRALTSITRCTPGFVGPGCEAAIARPDMELSSMIFDASRPGTLAFNLRAVKHVAGAVRDLVSLDMFRVLSHLPDTSAAAGDTTPRDSQGTRQHLGDALNLLNDLLMHIAAFSGLASDSMTRGHGWRFLDMGRRIERAMHIAQLLRSCLVSSAGHEAAVLEALLEIADSLTIYRRRYLNNLSAPAVVDMLLADAGNPRSVLFQLQRLGESLSQLPHPDNDGLPAPEHRVVLALSTAVQLADIGEICDTAGRRRPLLDQLLSQVESQMPLLAEALSHHFLSHLQTSRQLAKLAP